MPDRTAAESEEGIRAAAKIQGQQKRRLQMTGQVASAWAVDVLMLSLFAAASITSFAVPIGSATLATLVCGGTAFTILRGWNLRLQDPSMTMPQIVMVASAQITFIAWAPEIGLFFLIGLFIPLSFGALQLTRRQFIYCSTACGLATGIAIFIAGNRLGFPVANPVGLALMWLGFVSALIRFTYLMAYVSHLRESSHQRNLQLAASKEAIERMSLLDELTQVYNRRHMMNLLTEEKNRMERTGTEFAIAMLDLDNFKAVNDAFGHLKGDEVLKAFVETVRRSIRETDRLSRHGGEEFLVLLTATSEETAPVAAERIRAAVAHRDWEIIAPGLALTVSVGVTAYRKGESVEQSLGRADVALYEAKRGGRNRVVQG